VTTRDSRAAETPGYCLVKVKTPAIADDDPFGRKIVIDVGVAVYCAG
jgi:hypothetical protein